MNINEKMKNSVNLRDADTVKLVQVSESKEDDAFEIIQVMKLKTLIMILILIIKKCTIKKVFSLRFVKHSEN